MQAAARTAFASLTIWMVTVAALAQEAAEKPATPPQAQPAAEKAEKPAAKPSEEPAAKPAEKPAPGPASARFEEVFKEWKDLLAELRTLYQEYNLAEPARKSEIEKEYATLVAKGQKMEPEVVAAAKAAYAEAPESNTELGAFLLAMINNAIRRDDYDQACDLSTLLIDLKCPASGLESLAGYSSFAAGNYDDAKKYFKLAKEKKSLKPLKKDLLDNLIMQFNTDPKPFDEAWEKEQKIREAEAKADDLPRVLLKTSKGDMTLELFENEAPNTVANFISLVEKGYYNGIVFHRVLDGFMAQTGCPKGDGTGGPGYTIPDECRQDNYRQHFRGSLSMAKTAAPDSGGSQFFLTFVPTTHLDGQHTVFGRVSEGMDVLSKIRRIDPGKPGGIDPDKIIEAKVLRKREHPYVPKTIKEEG